MVSFRFSSHLYRKEDGVPFAEVVYELTPSGKPRKPKAYSYSPEVGRGRRIRFTEIGVLYRLPEVVAYKQSGDKQPILFCPDELMADRFAAEGACTTTNPGGEFHPETAT